jgi:hypothetical protein
MKYFSSAVDALKVSMLKSHMIAVCWVLLAPMHAMPPSGHNVVVVQAINSRQSNNSGNVMTWNAIHFWNVTSSSAKTQPFGHCG